MLKGETFYTRTYKDGTKQNISVEDYENNVYPNLEKGGAVFIAPNGKPSNLTPEQYKLVRTKAFKQWFGDWENNPESASKVVDSNGEPLVVYHGSPKNDINKFKSNFDGIFFTDNLDVASSISDSKLLTTNKLTKEEKNVLNKEYVDVHDYNNLFDDLKNIGYKIEINWENTADEFQESKYENVATITNLNGETEKYPLTYFRIDLIKKGIIKKGRNYQVFLNIRNPLKVNAKNKEWDNINYKGRIITTADIGELAQENKNDGSIIKDLYEYYIKSDVFIVFQPNQIKLADGSNTTFDSNNNDIRFNKGGLIAPNGNPSNLTPEQYKLVRTPAFKKWFGDWENDPTNASKVVDENGEPLVCYHASNKKFTKFKDSKYSNYIFFSNDKDHVEIYGDIIYECFLSIKMPSVNLYPKADLKENNQDGFINRYNTNNFFSIKTRVYAVLYSNQIKLADGTNTTFDSNNNDIRFDEGGIVIINPTEIVCHSCNWKWKVKDGGDDLYICHKCNYDNLKYYMFKEEKSKRDNMSYKQGGVIYQDLSLIPPTVLMESETALTTEIDEISIVKTGKTFVFNDVKITSSQQAYDLLKDFWRLENIDVVEEMNVIYLNKENKPISIYQHSKGGIDSTIADIEVISAIALKTLAKGVIIAHNHPSGNLNPSPADIEISQQLKNALKLFRIVLLDSMIVTKNNGYTSMADQGTFRYGGEINDKNLNLNCDCPKCMSHTKTLVLDEADTKDKGKMFLVKLEDFFYVIYDDEIVSKSNDLKEAKKDFELELYKDKVNVKKKFVRGGAITDSELEQIEKIVPQNMMLSIKENLRERKNAQEKGEDVENFDYFENLIEGYREIPKLYYQDEKGKNAIVYLHYFRGGSDWYITELDKETNEGFGYVVLNGDTQNSEFGYMNLNEFANSIIEIDLYWSFKTLNEIFEKQFPELVSGEIEYFNKDATLTRLTDYEILIEKNAFKNQYEVNQFIELMIDEKGMDNNLYTTIEQSFLQRYSGMGGLQKYGATGKGILWEYYTPKNVADIMWQLAYKYKSVSKFDRVLENSVGIGVFVNSCPLQVGSMDCYDISKYAIAICQILYGKDERFTFFNKSFETKFFNGNTSVKANVEPIYDLVIGNPPYSPYSGKYAGMGEKKYTKAENYIDYFIFRSLDLLKSGGLLVYILGSVKRMGQDNWLESKDNYTKNEIKKKADLVDALRLGSGVFEFTDVDSDIIVLRKK
jgi:hypothetical protein